jgi:hypothetical protein
MRVVHLRIRSFIAKIVQLFKSLMCFLNRKGHTPDEHDTAIQNPKSHRSVTLRREWADDWGEDELHQVCVETNPSKPCQSEEYEPDYFSEMTPQVSQTPRIILKPKNTAGSPTTDVDPGLIRANLEDWNDSEVPGWTGDDLDDAIDIAESAIKHQKDVARQKRFDQHHERNLRKQTEKSKCPTKEQKARIS